MNEFDKRIERIKAFGKNPATLRSLLTDHEDRATAIMIGGIIDDLLALGILAKFKRSPSENQTLELFTGYGPLSSLSARTSIGYLLGIIGADAKHDLGIIRRIRNDFAHIVEPINFETKSIADRCNSLKLQPKLSEDIEKSAGTGARGKFLRSAIRIFGLLILNSQLALEERKLIGLHQKELRAAAEAAMKPGPIGRKPLTFE